MKYNKYAHWALTGFVSLGNAFAGFMMLTGNASSMQNLMELGITNGMLAKFIGCMKIAGAAGLWVPRGKMWAYHGFTFLFAGAAVAHFGAGQGFDKIGAPLFMMALMGGSYYFWSKSPECKTHHHKERMAA